MGYEGCAPRQPNRAHAVKLPHSCRYRGESLLDFTEVIRKRRTIRKHRPDLVSQEDIEWPMKVRRRQGVSASRVAIGPDDA